MAGVEVAEVLRAVMDHVGAAIVAVDADDRLTFANPEAVRLLGVTVASSDWRAALDFRLPDEVTAFPRDRLPLRRALAGEATQADIYFAAIQRHVSVAARPFPLGAVALIYDIDARRRTEKELIEANRFLDSILDHVPTMIFVKEAAELRLTHFNRAGEELLGVSRASLLGRRDIENFTAAEARQFEAADRETLAKQVVVDIPEESIETPRGVRWLHTRKVPIVDDAGRSTFLVGISLDITDGKAAYDDLRRAREELEARVLERTEELKRAYEELGRSETLLRQAQRMEAVGRLAGGVAHDFNNMLTAISSHAQLLLLDGALAPRTRDGLTEILYAGERAAALTARLLAFSRQQVSAAQPADVGAVARSMHGMLQRLIREDIALSIEAATDLPPVLADPHELEQVVLNLVVNARDAMPSGGVLRVEVGVVADDVRLRVSDTGVGMDAATQARLFEPFFTTKPVGMGTGLGLSTTLELVRLRGGRIAVTSAVGCGSTFDVFLPVAHGACVPVVKVVPATLSRGVGTVLLVEDDELVRRAIGDVLETAGYDVLPASDATAALRIADGFAGRIDVLVTDMVMPGMNGRELAAALALRLGAMRVLFMSGYTDDAIARRDAGPGIAFLAKPFKPEDLTAKLGEILGGAAVAP